MTGNGKFDQMKPKAPPAQALVELAIILPILLLLILGAMDFGRMFITKNVLTIAAREGANYLAYYYKADTNYTKTKEIISDEISNSGVVGPSSVICFKILPGDCSTSGDYGKVIVNINVLPVNCCTPEYPVEVTVSITGIPLIFGGFYKSFFNMGEKLTLTSTVKMLVQ